jgi:hypothetical protein
MKLRQHCDYFLQRRNRKSFMTTVNVNCQPQNLGTGHIPRKSLTPDWLTMYKI